MVEYVKKIQASNMADLKQSCGKLSSSSSHKCLTGCTARWAAKGAQSDPVKKQNCIDMCNMKHTNWEQECLEQVDNLKNVYTVELGQLEGANKCVDQHCPKFPQVTMIHNDDAQAKLDEQQSVVDAGCDKACTDEGIEATCVKDFTLNIDFKLFEIEDKCKGSEEPKFDSCVKDNTGDIDGDADTCKSDGEGECDSQASDCMSEQSDDTASKEEGQKFCDEREKMCKEQVSAKCTKEHKAALDAASKECKKTMDADMKTCIDEETAKRKEEDVQKCVDETTPTCQDDCQGACQLEDLQKCQDDLNEAGSGVTEGFCKQFWQWLYDSEQVNAATGDVLPKALAVKTRAGGDDLM